MKWQWAKWDQGVNQDNLNIELYLELFEISAVINDIAADGTNKSFLFSSMGIENYVICKLQHQVNLKRKHCRN